MLKTFHSLESNTLSVTAAKKCDLCLIKQNGNIFILLHASSVLVTAINMATDKLTRTLRSCLIKQSQMFPTPHLGRNTGDDSRQH